ncbi:MAG: Bipolar DNA helicase [Spirochaetes bacterium GWF1_31_7]|nr:MAG: Bipolar DNA helicase [Spirochaetes bacterium GWE2_31_10]OHD49315.1 MAG: Bipolar DNA helicase [Spirochaetes bacterium GWF1_31_7]HBD96123.1 Bipolar DNA helicase [Spirochaetia bacterium]
MDSENFKIIGVSKGIVQIEVLDPTEYSGQFNIGSYIKIPYDGKSNNHIVGIINNYRIKSNDVSIPDSVSQSPTFIIEVELIGSYKIDEDNISFERGAHGIPLPPNNGIELLTKEDYNNVYTCKIKENEKFTFSKLLINKDINVPINGNKFFNKHFAIVGSTGSGKSHTVASILQNAIEQKTGKYDGLNNSHIVLFDIHGEYKQAFPDSNFIDFSNIKLPYWLFDSEELSDLFIESSEQNSHNQVSQFKFAVTENKKKENLKKPEYDRIPPGRIYFDTPIEFNIDEIINYIKNINNELVNKKTNRCPMTKADEIIKDRVPRYFDEVLEFEKVSADYVSGPFSGDFERFILRLETIRNNPRLNFLFNDVFDTSLEEVLQQFLGYNNKSKSNITIVDLSGIPFEVLSISVSLISRILFEFGYYYKKMLNNDIDCETPILLVYEEAHKYVPKSDLVKFRASKSAIERIAKEGRKYGVTLGIVSQRPSEISETIFSQCNNFVAMRLTNPEDQNYVKRLLPDNLGELTNSLPTLGAGEALITGEAIILPSLVKIDFPKDEPHSTDISYLEIWKEKWKDINFINITEEWKK